MENHLELLSVLMLTIVSLPGPPVNFLQQLTTESYQYTLPGPAV